MRKTRPLESIQEQNTIIYGMLYVQDSAALPVCLCCLRLDLLRVQQVKGFIHPGSIATVEGIDGSPQHNIRLQGRQQLSNMAKPAMAASPRVQYLPSVGLWSVDVV
jgi:hypothetical protein